MKYDFELKLKLLKFFYLPGVMPPPSNFSPKMDNWGGHDSGEYGNNLNDKKLCLKKF